MKNRQRGRNGGKPRPPGGGGGGPRNPNFDGGMRPRGNAQQLMEKFLAMARDATSMGDRVAAENYYQHADHYYRVLNARFEAQQQHPNQNQNQNQQHYNNGQRHPNQGGQRPGGYQAESQGGGYQGDEQSGGYDQQRQQYEQRPQYDQQRQSSNQGGGYQGEAARAPETQQPEPQPAAQSQAYTPAPEAGRASGDSDIGLPPQILGGGFEDRGSEAAPEGQGGDESRSPRRRRGRGPGVPRPSAGE
jgi:hypothetical protein